MFIPYLIMCLCHQVDARSKALLPDVGDYEKVLTRRQRENALKLYEGIAHGKKKVVTKQVQRER